MTCEIVISIINKSKFNCKNINKPTNINMYKAKVGLIATQNVYLIVPGDDAL